MSAAMPAAFVLPPFGTRIADGTYRGITTNSQGELYALILLDDKPSTTLDWRAAMAWAKELGGDLPSRAEAALLFETSKSEFEPRWYWTNAQYSDSTAYYQYFVNGLQDNFVKSWAGGSARAVRRLPIDPSILFAQVAA